MWAGRLPSSSNAAGNWLVICHGGCIRATCTTLTGASALALASPPNATATTFELGAQPRLLSYGTHGGGAATGLY